MKKTKCILLLLIIFLSLNQVKCEQPLSFSNLSITQTSNLGPLAWTSGFNIEWNPGVLNTFYAGVIVWNAGFDSDKWNSTNIKHEVMYRDIYGNWNTIYYKDDAKSDFQTDRSYALNQQ